MAMSVWTATPIDSPPEPANDISSASTRLREVVAALAAVVLRHREAEEAELAHAREDGVRERRLLPLLRVRRELLDDEGVDRLAQRLVLLGEDEVPARGGVVGLEDFGRGHSGNLRAAVRVQSMSSSTVRYDVARQRRRHDRARPARAAQRAVGWAARRSARRVRPGQAPTTRSAASCSRPRTRRSSRAGGDLAGFAAQVPLIEKFFATDRFPRLFQAIGEPRQADICAANGHVLAGALGLALACDLIVAKEGARFGTPEINVGMFPFMIMALIYRNVGRKKTNELLLLGEQIDAPRRSGSGSSTGSWRPTSSTPRSPTGRAGWRPSRRC